MGSISKQLFDISNVTKSELNYDKEIQASSMEIDTKLMVKSLKEYAKFLRNSGNTKYKVKKDIESIVNSLVEKDFFFSAFNVVKSLKLYVEDIYKTENLDNTLIDYLRKEYKVSNIVAENAIKFFYNIREKDVDENFKSFLSKYIK